MRTAGVFLVFAAVALRGAGLFWGGDRFGAVMSLLAVYGVLLIVKTWFIRAKSGDFTLRAQTDSKVSRLWNFSKAIYLVLQSTLIVLILDKSAYEDFFNLLFISPSLDAVTFFGRRAGYVWIAAFSIAIISVMQFSEQGQLFGLAMGILYSGMCLLFGGYAYQVLKAEAAREKNQSAFDELQATHRQLQGYAEQAANLAVERERNRLARDLHDSVTQTVFSMNLAAQSSRLLFDKATPQTSGQLIHLEGLSVNALSEIQSLVSQLKPRSVAEEGLPAALRRLVVERNSRDGLQISLEIHGGKTLSEAESLGLYSIVNEALTNIVKHSGTREASVRLNFDDSSSLEIEDRGLGFDPRTVTNRRGHLGLAGMSERAREIGWGFSVESNPNRGTKISVTQNQAGAEE